MIDNLQSNQEENQVQEEVLDENGKPFWMKFLKADYLAEVGISSGGYNANKNTNKKGGF